MTRSKNMKTNILTARFGGPFHWGKDLTSVLNSRGIAARHFHTVPRLVTSALYQDADIIHTTIPFPFKLWQKPLVLTMHGEYTIEHNIWQRFYPKTIAQTNVITVPSHYLKQRLELQNAIVIPNALFTERFKSAQHGDREQLNLVSVTVFHFANKVAGIPKIIEVLDKIQNCRFTYTVVGGGRHLETVKKQASGTSLDIRFTDFLPDPRPSLAASDIFLYYSYHDNFPNVILEAMASGLPVITNNVGAVTEIIDHGKNGYIAESDEAYLEHLLNLVNNSSLRQNIGLKARQTMEEKFDWSKVISSYIDIYKTL